MHEDIGEILYSEDVIRKRVQELGAVISESYANRGGRPLVICILKGAFVFMADLARCVTIPIELDFMAVSSYGKSTRSSGEVKIIKDLDTPVEGRDVIIVEDIIDSGLTLGYLVDVLERRNALTVRIAALFDKPDRRVVDLTADYIGFVVPNAFIVGYGLDYAEKYRNLPYVGVLKREIYAG